MREFTVSNDLIGQPELLRERAENEGYLFFRGLLEAQPLLEVRRQILEVCAKHGWLEPGTEQVEGIAASGLVRVAGNAKFNRVYSDILRLEEFHALAHQPAITGIYETLFQEPVLVHPRNIARVIFPRAENFTTPAHQDYIHIQGTTNFWTTWFSLGDCPRSLGGLAVLEGSHHAGLFEMHPARGAGGLGIDTDELEYEWVSSEMKLGDVLMFNSHTVHKGLPNVSENKIRVSVDFRYQGVSQPVVEGSLLPHEKLLSWEEIYRGWNSPELQYYWRDLPTPIVEYRPKHEFETVPTRKSKVGVN